MSALKIIGTIVSTDTYRGVSKKNGNNFTVHTCYVVNGGGPPLSLKIMKEDNPFKVGQKVEIPVKASYFGNEISYYPVELN